MEDERSAGNPTTPKCRSCGHDEHAGEARERDASETFQVIVACAACGFPLAALSRN